ncbi:MAG: transglutaminase-like domain-containing protein, partial [Chitinophagaceae bacterium]
KENKNVTIPLAKEEYTFVYNKRQNRVEVKQTQYQSYLCNNIRIIVPIGETYNDNISIDEIAIKIDGSKNKTITPRYDYFSRDDIFFSDLRICYFNLPLETKGSTGEITFEKTILDPKYFTQIFFSEQYDVEEKIVKINVPKWMKIDIKEYNFKGFNIEKEVTYNEKKEADVYTYTIKKLATIPSENHSPGATYIQPHLLMLVQSATIDDNKFTFFETLKDQYAWYRSLVKDIDNDKAILKAKAIEITQTANTKLDKIKAIFYWVQNNIRYLAFEDGIAGFKPDKANEVLRKKYGDCKGMAHLTKELLQALNFDARLCWIGTNHIAYDYSTPSLSVDNHMICALFFEGKTYFLDATEKYIGFNEYAERIQGRQVLIENNNAFVLSNVPTTTFEQNKYIEKRNLTINGTSLMGTVEQIWNGEEKEYILSQLFNIKKENVTNAFKKYLADENANILITNLNTSDLNNYDQALKANYSFEHKNALTAFGKEMYLEVDLRKDFNNFTFDTLERKLDYCFSHKYNLQENTVINLPKGATVTTLPKKIEIQQKDYAIKALVKVENNQIIYIKEIVIKNPIIQKSNFSQWNKDFTALKDFYAEQVVIAIP